MLNSCLCLTAVTALRAIRRKLSDPKKRLNNWKSKDPCASNWTGVICSMNPDDGYLHVQELYVYTFINLDLFCFSLLDAAGSVISFCD